MLTPARALPAFPTKLREFPRRKTTTAALLALLAVASCSKPKPVVVIAPPPAPVGHIYATLVPVPAPSHDWIKVTPAQELVLQQAFNIIGLKSALMVGALTCGQQNSYDSFMMKFQPHILAEQHVMDGYFHRIDGYAGQHKEDSFVTELANNQSVDGIAQGSLFCLNNGAEFSAVMALPTPQTLDAFVTDKPPAAAPNELAASAKTAP